MLQLSIANQNDLKHGVDQIRREISQLRKILAVRHRDRACLDIKYQLAVLRCQIALIRHAYVCRKAGFNPDQPRVPAGSHDGGQWTSEGGGAASLVSTGDVGNTPPPVRLANANDVVGLPVMSDATPDPIRPGAQYAQTGIEIKPNALIGDPIIVSTTVRLTTILAHAMDIVEPISDALTPQEYGRLVHERFADTVRILGLPGIAYDDVETTFGGEYYGAKGSVRTDVVLRDETGTVIAIYDVKTGEAIISEARAAQLRAKVGVDDSVPIYQLQVRHGVVRKGFKQHCCTAYRFVDR